LFLGETFSLCRHRGLRGLLEDPWEECFTWFWELVLAKPFNTVLASSLVKIMASSVWATSPYRTQLDAQVAADLGSIFAFQGLQHTARTLLRVLPATAPETCKAFLKLFESEKENDWIKWAVSLRDRSIGKIITRAQRHPECSCLLVPFLARLLKWRRRKEGPRWSLTDEGSSFVDDDVRKMLDQACLCVFKDKRVAKEFGKVGTVCTYSFIFFISVDQIMVLFCVGMHRRLPRQHVGSTAFAMLG